MLTPITSVIPGSSFPVFEVPHKQLITLLTHFLAEIGEEEKPVKLEEINQLLLSVPTIAELQQIIDVVSQNNFLIKPPCLTALSLLLYIEEILKESPLSEKLSELTITNPSPELQPFLALRTEQGMAASRALLPWILGALFRESLILPTDLPNIVLKDDRTLSIKILDCPGGWISVPFTPKTWLQDIEHQTLSSREKYQCYANLFLSQAVGSACFHPHELAQFPAGLNMKNEAVYDQLQPLFASGSAFWKLTALSILLNPNAYYPDYLHSPLIFEIIPRLLDYSETAKQTAIELLNHYMLSPRCFAVNDFLLDDSLETRQLHLVCHAGLLGTSLQWPAVSYFGKLIQYGAPAHLADNILDFVGHINKVAPLESLYPIQLFDQLVSQEFTWEPKHLQRLLKLATQLLEQHPTASKELIQKIIQHLKPLIDEDFLDVRQFTLFARIVIAGHPELIEDLWPYIRKVLENERDLTEASTLFFHNYLKQHFDTFSAPFRAKSLLTLYHNRAQTWNLDRAKAPGLDDRNSVHTSKIVQPRELSHGTKSKFEPDCGISLNNFSPRWKNRARQLVEEDLSTLQEDSEAWHNLNQIVQIYQQLTPTDTNKLKLSDTSISHIVDTKKEAAWHQKNLAVSTLAIQSLLDSVKKNQNGMREKFLSKTVTLLNHHNSAFFKEHALEKAISPHFNTLISLCNNPETLRLILTCVETFGWEKRVLDDRLDLFCQQALCETKTVPFDRQLATRILELRNKKQLTFISPHLVTLALKMIEGEEAANSNPWWEVLNQIKKHPYPTLEQTKKLILTGLNYTTEVPAFDEFVTHIPRFFSDKESRSTNLLNLIEVAWKTHPTKAFGFIKNILKEMPSLTSPAEKSVDKELPERLFCWILDQQTQDLTRFYLADKIRGALDEKTLHSYADLWNSKIKETIENLEKQNKLANVKALQSLKTTILLQPKDNKSEEPSSTTPVQASKSKKNAVGTTNLEEILQELDSAPLDLKKTDLLHHCLLAKTPAKVADSRILTWATTLPINPNKELVAHRFCNHIQGIPKHRILFEEILTRMISLIPESLLEKETPAELSITNFLLIKNLNSFTNTLNTPLNCYKFCKWVLYQFLFSERFTPEKQSKLLKQLDILLQHVMSHLAKHKDDLEVKRLFETDMVTQEVSMQAALALYLDNIFMSEEGFTRYQPFKEKDIAIQWLSEDGRKIAMLEAFYCEGKHLVKNPNPEAIKGFLEDYSKIITSLEEGSENARRAFDLFDVLAKGLRSNEPHQTKSSALSMTKRRKLK